jgi:HK97 family phage portal protein
VRILGLDITRAKALARPTDRDGAWRPVIRESFTGAWQSNIEVSAESVASNHAIFACQTLIASDIAKLRVKLVVQDAANPLIWTETTNAAYSPVIRKPNHYQTRLQFWESWILSKLSRGNTYVLKARDARNVVTALYVLSPDLVTPLVSDDGQVFYELRTDTLAGITDRVIVPAREIIHDRFNCLFHPLVGISPIYACGLAATQGQSIQTTSTNFFRNGARPGGILTVPGKIDIEMAVALKNQWETGYGGDNSGKIAVLSDGMKYDGISVTPVDSQLVEQLKWTAETVCSTYHVPPYKLGIGTMPTNSNVQALNVEYYTQCLQSHIEAAELCLDEGLGIGESSAIGTEFDTDGLLRMDSLTMLTSLKSAVDGGIMAPDDARARIGLKGTPGGSTPYMQQQNYSLAALAKRDAGEDPFASKSETVPALPVPDQVANDNAARAQVALFEKRLREGLNA